MSRRLSGGGGGEGARGWGGQNCFVLEDLDMVVVTNGNIRNNSQMIEAAKRLIKDYVVPSHVGPHR